MQKYKALLYVGGATDDWREDYLVSEVDAAVKEKDTQIVQGGAIVDAIDMILSAGEEPSDFMLSFPLVRAAWDQCQQIAALKAERDKYRDRKNKLTHAYAAKISELHTLQSDNSRRAEEIQRLQRLIDSSNLHYPIGNGNSKMEKEIIAQDELTKTEVKESDTYCAEIGNNVYGENQEEVKHE